MKENNSVISTELLLAAFRALTPENQRLLIESLKALGSSSRQKPDSDGSEK